MNEFAVLTVFPSLVTAVPLSAHTVTYLPYIQPAITALSDTKDQMVVAWQTDEPVPVTSARLTALLLQCSILPVGPLEILALRQKSL